MYDIYKYIYMIYNETRHADMDFQFVFFEEKQSIENRKKKKMSSLFMSAPPSYIVGFIITLPSLILSLPFVPSPLLSIYTFRLIFFTILRIMEQ